jgi:hypothetical protein
MYRPGQLPGRASVVRCGSCRCLWLTEPVLLNVYGAPELIPRNEFRQPICSLEGRYDNPIPPRFLAPIDFLKIPALECKATLAYTFLIRIHRWRFVSHRSLAPKFQHSLSAVSLGGFTVRLSFELKRFPRCRYNIWRTVLYFILNFIWQNTSELPTYPLENKCIYRIAGILSFFPTYTIIHIGTVLYTLSVL